MFNLKKSPLHNNAKQNSFDPGFPSNHGPNPFDSDEESDNRRGVKPSRRTSSEPTLGTQNVTANPFDDNEVNGNSSSSYSLNFAARNKYKNNFSESGGLENQTVEELENYAVYKAEETTKTVNTCVKIAEDIREDATKTMVTLHQQGEQITRTHMVTSDIDQDLSRGEKLLGSLGGIFSKAWKPKGRKIEGPMMIRDDPAQRRGNHLEQREKLGLAPMKKRQSNGRTPLPEPTNALQKVEVEKVKQDDGLSDLSNILEELKEMAIDMGSEIEWQNKALDPLQRDVDEMNAAVRNANVRGRRLLGK